MKKWSRNIHFGNYIIIVSKDHHSDWHLGHEYATQIKEEISEVKNPSTNQNDVCKPELDFNKLCVAYIIMFFNW